MRRYFEIKFNLKIPNPIWKIYFNRRIKKACNYWNKNILPKVNPRIKNGEMNGHDSFLWTIVWQEVQMWIQIADKKTVQEEFDLMCRRRGFNDEQKEALAAIMRELGLY